MNQYEGCIAVPGRVSGKICGAKDVRVYKRTMSHVLARACYAEGNEKHVIMVHRNEEDDKTNTLRHVLARAT